MAWFNEEIAALLREYAELTQITGGDVFRARNYEKAARSVRGWGDDIGQLDATALRAIPGVGASIAAKIAEYRESGSIRALDQLRAKIPPGHAGGPRGDRAGGAGADTPARSGR